MSQRERQKECIKKDESNLYHPLITPLSYPFPLAVPLNDDPALPVVTFRFWIISFLFAALGSTIQQYDFSAQPQARTRSSS